MNKLPELKWLKDNCERIYYFGLGFIQVKVDNQTRYNFYHPDLLPCFVKSENVHTHPYDYKSYILKGGLIEKLYAVEPTIKSSRYFCRIDCRGGHENLFKARTVVRSEITHPEGTEYLRFSDDLHKVLVNTPTITKVVKGEHSNYAFSFIPDDQQTCTPFISNMSEEECWHIVKEILKC